MTELTIKNVVQELASGAVIRREGDGYFLVRDCGLVPDHLIDQLSKEGWLEPFANGGGAWLSDLGRLQYLKSTDELGDGKLVSPRAAQGDG